MLQMKGALVLESQSTDRLLSEPHLDHISQEGAFAASEPTEPQLIGHNSQCAFSRVRRDAEQGSLGLSTQHIASVLSCTLSPVSLAV